MFSSDNGRTDPKLIGRYSKETPIELFRIQGTKRVSLREYAAQMAKNRMSFDLRQNPESGLVEPRNGEYFEGPNGMSIRPLGPVLHEVVRTFRGGKNTTIYRLPKGTPLEGEDLQLLHEHSDHYSLQCSKPMTLSALNHRMTEFMQKHAEQLTRQNFVDRYPYTANRHQ